MVYAAAAESKKALGLLAAEEAEAEAIVEEAEEAWWEEAKALEEIFEDWQETVAEEESVRDCSFEEAKALAAEEAERGYYYL